jgi:carbon monoxide dehydrogenase subunit G
MFRIKASYADQLELRTTLEKAREFFGELRNFADLMPGIEGIRKEAGGIMRWMVRADVPVRSTRHLRLRKPKILPNVSSGHQPVPK